MKQSAANAKTPVNATQNRVVESSLGIKRCRPNLRIKKRKVV